MKIAVLTSLYPSLPRPFEGVFAERRWRGMVARGHVVRVVHPLPRTPGPFSRGAWAEIRAMPEVEERGPIVVRRPRYFHVPRWARRNAANFVRVGAREILARGRPDVVVADYAWPAGAAAALFAAEGIPFVINGRGSDVLQVAGEAGLGGELATALRTAGHWCAVSAALVATMDRLAGGEGRGRLVPNGVDLELFAPVEKADARHRLGMPEDIPLVLVVGHLVDRKDPLLALEAFARGAPAHARLAFLGRGALRPRLEQAVAEKGIAARVHFAGEVAPADLAAWYGACDALLLTSHREGRPNVVLEALASGRPVVATVGATGGGGTAECLVGWEEESLVTTRSADDVAEKLARLLATPPPAARLRESVAHLSWGKSLDALESCLEDARTGRP